MRKYFTKGVSFLIVLLFVFKFGIAQAAGSAGNCVTGTLCNPLSTGNSLTDFLQAIVDNVVLPVGAIIAVLAFIFTGFLYVMAQGNESKLSTAHKSLLYTSIGTALLLGAWTIATVVQNTVHNITTP